MKEPQLQKLFFLQDLTMGSRTIYSGHTGTGKKFKMYQGDYGKYAMKPTTHEKCEELKRKIEKDAKGGSCIFKWNIVPITEIQLYNFYEPKDHDEFKKLQQEQKKLSN